MIRIKRYLAFFILFILVAAALNISNEAINQLTGANRQAIIGADYKQDNICFYIMGQSYVYERDELSEIGHTFERSSRQLMESIMQYSSGYVKIFHAVFLQ